MLIEPGSKLLIVHRRLYDRDRARFFVGVVEAYQDGLARVTGHTWAQDAFHESFVKKEDARCKIIPLTSGALIVYLLPNTLNLARVEFHADPQGRLWLRDGEGLGMDLTEMQHAKV